MQDDFIFTLTDTAGGIELADWAVTSAELGLNDGTPFEIVKRTLDEHAELRELNRRLAEPDGETLARFATLLSDHVRFEERELFETAQRLLYPE